MKEINLRDYYPFYTKDKIIEVSDEVAALLRAYKLLDEAQRIRTYRYRAFYSLDYADIAYASLPVKPAPGEVVEQRYINGLIYKGLATLTEKQRNRIYAHYFLQMSIADIARLEGCAFMSVKESIGRGLKRLEKFFYQNQ